MALVSAQGDENKTCYLLDMPDDLFEKVAEYMDEQEAVALARSSKEMEERLAWTFNWFCWCGDNVFDYHSEEECKARVCPIDNQHALCGDCAGHIGSCIECGKDTCIHCNDVGEPCALCNRRFCGVCEHEHDEGEQCEKCGMIFCGKCIGDGCQRTLHDCSAAKQMVGLTRCNSCDRFEGWKEGKDAESIIRQGYGPGQYIV